MIAGPDGCTCFDETNRRCPLHGSEARGIPVDRQPGKELQRGVVLVDFGALAALIGLPKGHKIVACEEPLAAGKVRLIIEGPQMPRVPDGGELQYIPAVWLPDSPDDGSGNPWRKPGRMSFWSSALG